MLCSDDLSEPTCLPNAVNAPHAGGGGQVQGADRYVSALIGALRHPEPDTRQFAAWMLGRKKAAQAVPALLAAIARFRESDRYFVATAVQALGAIGNPGAIPLLADLLDASYLVVRLAAVEALARIGTPDAREALGRAPTDPSSAVREAAAQFLQAGTTDPTPNPNRGSTEE
ncbi:MAG: HEAT repeat domain-containing protein [Bacillota bacterium]|nr:HEAT repeat domain-containing protein [Bacillota bacterium]